MMVTAVIVAVMATVATAAPGGYGCKPGTYQCSGTKGWQVCNTSGQWINGGTCPPYTVCKFYPPSKSPYCVPTDFTFNRE